MVKSILIGGIVGGLLLFVEGAVSWMVLPWHEATLNQFSNEDVVSVTLGAYAPKSGVYYLPANDMSGETPAERKAAGESAKRKMAEGPLVFAAIRTNGMSSMTTPMIQGLMIQIMAAMLVTWMLLNTRIASYGGRVLFVMVFAVAASIIGNMPNYIWWGFSAGYTAVNLADMLIGWLLAGLLIAAVTRPPSESKAMPSGPVAGELQGDSPAA